MTPFGRMSARDASSLSPSFLNRLTLLLLRYPLHLGESAQNELQGREGCRSVVKKGMENGEGRTSDLYRFTSTEVGGTSAVPSIGYYIGSALLLTRKDLAIIELLGTSTMIFPLQEPRDVLVSM